MPKKENLLSFRVLFKTPYPYIFLISYYGVWLIWIFLKVTVHPPEGISSPLVLMHYNPVNNILRFIVAIFVPPVSCLIYWWFEKNYSKTRWLHTRLTRHTFASIVVGLSLILALSMGILQGSTNPANNPVGEYGGPYSNFLVDTFHEGETLGPAISYQQDNLKPYTNFVVIHGVFQDPLRTVISFKLFGRTIGAERTFNVILLMTTFVCYLVLLLVLFKFNYIKAGLGLSIVGLLLVPNNTLPYIHQAVSWIQLPFRDIATIVFLVTAVLGFRYALSKRYQALTIISSVIGLIVTASFAISVDRAIYITILSAVWVVLIWLMVGNRVWIKRIVTPVFVGLLLGLIVLYTALKGDLYGLLHYLITISRYKDYLDGEVFAQPGLASSIILLGIGTIIAIVFAWFAGFWDNRPKGLDEGFRALKEHAKTTITNYHTEILLGVTSIVFMRSAIGRADEAHLAYSIQWLYLFLAYVGINYIFSHRKRRLAINFGSLLLFLIVLVFYAGSIKNIDIARDTFPLHVPDSKLVRTDYTQTANYIKQNLSGKQTFVTLTSEGVWYYLVNKPSPISYPIIWYAFTAPQRQIIASQIQDNPNIKYIITNNNWTSDFDFIPNTQRFPEVYMVLYSLYHPEAGFGQQTVWERNN
jgi:hypothetical protein